MSITTSANSFVPHRDVDFQVNAELTNILYRNIPVALLGFVILASLLTVFFREAIGNPVALGWLVSLLLIEAVRLMLGAIYRGREISLGHAPRWTLYINATNVASGLAWGIAGLLFFLPGSPLHQVVLAVALIGVCAVAIPILAINARIYLGFVFIVITPISIRLIMHGSTTALTTATLILLVVPILIAFALRTHNEMVQNLRTRFAYADLARELSGEIAVRRQTENRLLELANFDQLTNLPNRTLLADRVEQALAKARRNNNVVAVLFIDLDRFKTINDSLGHSVGDEVLQEIAKRLTRSMREENTVARLSGDEFVVVLEDTPGNQAAATVARRILAEISEPLELIDGTELKMSCSIGISLYPNNGDNVDTLFQNADIAMYHAKKSGRNNFQFFTADMHADAIHRLSRENALRKGMEREEFFLVYQPQYDARTSKMIGAEALIRWNSPDYGQVSPAEFIPLAEECNLIKQIGEWVLRTSCQMLRSIIDEFGEIDFHLSVNLSVRQLEGEEFVHMTEKLLQEMRLPARMLMLEITESIALSNVHSNLAQLRKLRSLGIPLALDNFGTGNSSMAYLKRFPLSMVKLDKTFIENVTANREDAAIASSTINLANALHLQVLAAGIETRDQVTWLLETGCHLMQGFLFSPPLPALELKRQLAMTHPDGLTAG